MVRRRLDFVLPLGGKLEVGDPCPIKVDVDYMGYVVTEEVVESLI